jgi:hypothetical protein
MMGPLSHGISWSELSHYTRALTTGITAAIVIVIAEIITIFIAIVIIVIVGRALA